MNKPYIIAEIGVNYYDIAKERNISVMEGAKLMIKKAKEGGANAAKFQSYKASTIASKNSPAYWDTSKEPTKSQYELFTKFDKFGEEEYKELSEYCNTIGIDFLSTPFDLNSVDFLDQLMKYFKIASADITNYPLLKKVASKGKTMILSTGASTINEIKDAINVIREINSDIEIILLHCVLSYPTKYEDTNINRISLLKEKFPDVKIGFSDHTPPDDSMITDTTAYILGAEIIEKHFTLDKKLQGNDHYHAMNVEDLKKLVKNIEIINKIRSKNEIEYLDCEKVSRVQARRSIVLTRDMRTGERIQEKDLIMKRPGSGISPTEIDSVIGKKINKDLKEDHILTIGDLE